MGGGRDIREASAFMGYLEARCREVDEQGQQLQPLYSIHGESHLPEFELDHLEGYKGAAGGATTLTNIKAS